MYTPIPYHNRSRAMADSKLDPTDRVEVLKAVKEISGAMTRIEAERDLIRGLKKTVVEEQEVDKKALNRIIKTYHKGSFQEEQEVWTEFEELYTTIVGK
jgi:hypothetical protein